MYEADTENKLRDNKLKPKKTRTYRQNKGIEGDNTSQCGITHSSTYNKFF